MTKTSSMKLVAKCTWFKRVSWEVLYFCAKFSFPDMGIQGFFFFLDVLLIFFFNQSGSVHSLQLIDQESESTCTSSLSLFKALWVEILLHLFSFTAHSIFLPQCFLLHWKESNLTSIMNYRTTIVRKKFQNGCCYLESCFHIGLS